MHYSTEVASLKWGGISYLPTYYTTANFDFQKKIWKSLSIDRKLSLREEKMRRADGWKVAQLLTTAQHFFGLIIGYFKVAQFDGLTVNYLLIEDLGIKLRM